MCTRSRLGYNARIYGRIEKHTARVIVCRVSCVLYAVVDVFPVAGGVRVIPPPVWVCVACNSRLNLFRRLARF